MAIDDREKRQSASGIQTTLIAGVTNNAGKDQEWRQQSGWSYSGILAGVITVLEQVKFVFGAIAQSKLASVVKADPSLASVAIRQSTLSDITILE